MEEVESSQGLTNSDLKHSSNVDNFRSSLHNMELQLAKVRESKTIILNKIEEANDILENFQKKIARIEEEIIEKDNKIQELKLKAEQNTSKMPQGSAELLSFHHQLKMKDEEISDLTQLLSKKELIIESLKTHTYLEEHKLASANISAAENISRAKELKSRLEKTQKKIDLCTFTKRNEGTLMIELEHYKADNERLISLLKSTSEFSIFGDFAEASEGIRYLPRTNKVHYKVQDDSGDWLPQESYKMVNEFLVKYGDKGFKSAEINKLLGDLNSIWRRREKNLMGQVKSKCNRESDTLKRKVLYAPKLDQFVAEKNINRLKSDLKKANEELRAVSSASVRAIARPHGFI
ncbi:hypothetical protein SteCoe_14736 [Stentor coeruleus]|uniref:Uncharacterized protein n=1 Tax=Stentor coeruleus TaxID=5963 RepID=A0A1R2C580_9CILI|nr:hypothetical protein SteCoe_14736 [Stentor coeruleus]